jgi:hypothetical protein
MTEPLTPEEQQTVYDFLAIAKEDVQAKIDAAVLTEKAARTAADEELLGVITNLTARVAVLENAEPPPVDPPVDPPVEPPIPPVDPPQPPVNSSFMKTGDQMRLIAPKDMQVQTVKPGKTGEATIGYWGYPGEGVEIDIVFAAPATDYEITFRYANGTPNPTRRRIDLMKAGAVVATTVFTYAPSGQWNTAAAWRDNAVWKVQVPSAGTYTLRSTCATQYEYLDYDYIKGAPSAPPTTQLLLASLESDNVRVLVTLDTAGSVVPTGATEEFSIDNDYGECGDPACRKWSMEARSAAYWTMFTYTVMLADGRFSKSHLPVIIPKKL